MSTGPITSQPQGTAPMAAGGNKNALNREIGADGQRDWSFGLFDCFDDCTVCCWSVWCPCVIFSKNRERLQHLQTRGTPLVGGADGVDGNCAIYACLLIPNCAWVLQTGTRTDVRAHYSVRGDAVVDCLSSTCCRPCALTQESREIELEENSFEGFSKSK